MNAHPLISTLVGAFVVAFVFGAIAKVAIGSTRPGRKGEAVARWVHDLAQQRGDAEFELVDLKAFNLPLLDEPVPPSQGQYSQPHTKAWAAKIDPFDACFCDT